MQHIDSVPKKWFTQNGTHSRVNPHRRCQVQLIHRHPRWRCEAEPLQEEGEEEEELHPGQALSHTGPSP